MNYWITSLDGHINFHVVADSPDESLQALASSLGFPSYEAMCVDLGYSGRQFTICTITEELGEYNRDRDRANVNRQRESIVLGAFKHIARLANGRTR